MESALMRIARNRRYLLTADDLLRYAIHRQSCKCLAQERRPTTSGLSLCSWKLKVRNPEPTNFEIKDLLDLFKQTADGIVGWSVFALRVLDPSEHKAIVPRLLAV
jgi:hypothetical protein